MPHIHHIYCPTSAGGRIKPTALNYIKGKGMGSVLLRTGGPGGGSSYSSLDDYVSTTGLPLPSISGRGLGSISKKLEALTIKPSGKKIKNIKFDL
jgi:hypothetical protein